MTKQEEIREGIERIILATYHAGAIGTNIGDALEVSTGELLAKLHSQGVVIKVDMELPEFPLPMQGDLLSYEEQIGWKRMIAFFLHKADYVAVEPLIKEE